MAAVTLEAPKAAWPLVRTVRSYSRIRDVGWWWYCCGLGGWGAGGVGGLLSDCLPLWLRLGAKSYGVLAVFR